ncbi:GDSL esterase/lipase At1g29660-like [Punica granatum]|uniref:GDSL esterase/lipase At1g29660-like n=1 Tax=Punica granatum TaxID=22663 RepID=A0A6P8DKT8_PUNGR|nr:GDSL esterase/lipase At1g29660-like [Punica granatum]
MQGGIAGFSDHLKHHADTVSRIIRIFRGNKNSALSHLSKCLYHVHFGNNDYISNYFDTKHFSTSHRYNEELFADLLIQTYRERIRTLHEYGARKIMLTGVAAIGCMPYLLAKSPQTSSRCVEYFHSAVRIFNAKLKALVDDLNRDYSDSKFIYIEFFESLQEILDSPSYGFNIKKSACCGRGRYNGRIPCLPNLIPCRDRDQYVFWDPYHSTEAASLIQVKKLFNNDSRSSFTYPMTILELAKL